MERGILVVSFGTTYQETREKNIDQMVALVREQYPHYLVEEAYSSSTVRKVLRERDGIAKDDVRQALCRMRDAGVRRVIVFPTHIIDGIENRRMKQEVTDCAPWFEDVRIADALLKTPEDYQRTAEALWESVAAEAGSSPVIFMGHGSEHAADESYERLECVLAQVTENDVYVATVEGSVTIDDVIGRMKVSRHKSVCLWRRLCWLREIMPIMIWQERRIPLLPHSARRDMNRSAC
jgi:sirohydrochlorin cobaltochelatase